MAAGNVTLENLIENYGMYSEKYSVKAFEIPERKVNRERVNFSTVLNLSPREFNKFAKLAKEKGLSRSELLYRCVQHLF